MSSACKLAPVTSLQQVSHSARGGEVAPAARQRLWESPLNSRNKHGLKAEQRAMRRKYLTWLSALQIHHQHGWILPARRLAKANPSPWGTGLIAIEVWGADCAILVSCCRLIAFGAKEPCHVAHGRGNYAQTCTFSCARFHRLQHQQHHTSGFAFHITRVQPSDFSITSRAPPAAGSSA